MSSDEIVRPEWPEQVRRLLGRLKLSQTELATRVGVSPSTVTRWMKGSHEPTAAAYVALGNLVGAPEGVYFWERAGVDAAKFPETNLRAAVSSLRVDLTEFRLLPGHGVTEEVLVQRPAAVVLPLMNLTAYGDRMPPGPHVTLSQAKVEDVLMAPASWCPHPEQMLCLRLNGDSMMPVIPEDSILSVDTAVTERTELQKRIAVFSHRDLGMKVARLQRLGTTDILVSANHNCLPVDVSDESKWRAVGEVVWWVSKDARPREDGKGKSTGPV